MRKIILYLILLFVGCATKRDFPQKNVCFLLFNLKTNEYEKELNPKFCKIPQLPASTFKVPLAIMGFESGVLKDETTMFKWDGKKHFLDAHNKDHTAATWMRDSVVWYSQVLAEKMGKEMVQNYVTQLNYGNKDTSGELTTFWLPNEPKASIKISAYEQVEFMKKLWKEELPFSKRSQELTKKILVREINPPHRELAGKTGSGYVNDEKTLRLGWYIAHLKSGLKEYIVVTNFTDKVEMPQPRSFGGPEAKELTKQLLTEDDLF